MGNLVFEAASGGSTTISGPDTTGSNTITIPNASGTFALTNTPVTTATNLAGGSTGAVPYQSGTGSTTFLAAGTNGQVLTLSGGLPTWSAVSGTGDVVGPASATNNAIATYDGTTGKLIKNNSGVTINADVITASGFSGPLTGTATYSISAGTANTSITANTATYSISAGSASTTTNISGGATGSVPYQSGTGSTTFLAAGSNGQVLTLSGGVPTWAAVGGTGTVTNVSALTIGTTGTDLSSTVANSTTTPVITLNVPTASATNRGVLSAADWTTFNNKGSGTVTSVTGTAPVVSSGGTTPAISMAAASASANGYLTSTDWTTFNNKGSGTVTSVDATAGTGISITGGPITSSGSITVTNTLPMVYPGAGVANSTGSAWGTSYSTSGTGTALALAYNADLVTPTATGIKEKSTAISASNIDLGAGNYFTKTISGTTTFTISNAAASGTVNSFILQLTNGGSATVNWFSGVKWAGGTAPTLTTSGYDDLGFFTIDGGTTWQGFVLGKAMA